MRRSESARRRKKRKVGVPDEVLCAGVEGLGSAALDIGQRGGDKRLVALAGLRARRHGAQDGGNCLQEARRQGLEHLLVDAAAKNGLVLIRDVELQE